MKKLLSVVLVLVMALSVFSVTASALPSELLNWWDVHEGGLYYTVYNDGEASVEGFDEDHAKTNPNLVIPSSVAYGGDTYKVTYISESAFATSEYKTITLPSSINIIDYEAFGNCKKLEKVIIPNDCEFVYFSSSAFADTPFEAEIYSNEYTVFGKNVLFSYTGSGEFTIPENITYIAEQCFMMSGIEKVVFNDKITEIPTSAFANCTDLKEVVFSNSIEYVGNCAFKYCTSLENVVLSDSVSILGYDAFANSGLKTLHIGRHAYDIAGAFANCNNFESVTISPSNTVYFTDGKAIYENSEFFEIDDFGNFHTVTAKMLTYYFLDKAQGDITLPSEIKGISSYAFYGCKKLDSVVAPGVIFVDDYAFKNSSIKSFSSNEDYDIYVGAFQNCKNLTSVNLENVTYIDDAAFENCESLVDVQFSAGIGYIGSAAFANTGIKEITISGNECIIGEGAFMNCKNLETVRLEEGVTEIWQNAFLGCPKLTTIYLSKTVKYFDDNALNGCDNVTFEVIKNTAAYKYVNRLGFNLEVVGKLSFWQRIIDFFRSLFG